MAALLTAAGDIAWFVTWNTTGQISQIFHSLILKNPYFIIAMCTFSQSADTHQDDTAPSVKQTLYKSTLTLTGT